MTAFWCNFDDGSSVCVEVSSGEGAVRAAFIATSETGKHLRGISRLPYPAEPRLNHLEHEVGGVRFVCPSLCFSPDECAGMSSCPRAHACSE